MGHEKCLRHLDGAHHAIKRNKVYVLIIDYKKTLILLRRVILGLLNILKYIPGFGAGRKVEALGASIDVGRSFFIFTV